MQLGLLLAQMLTSGCNYRIFKQIAEVENGFGLESNRKYKNKSLAELLEIEVIKVEVSPDFPEAIVFDIFIK